MQPDMAERLAEALAAALLPFSKIVPSTLYANDGSEREGYEVVLTNTALGVLPDFTGEDLAHARAALAAYRASKEGK